MDFISHILVSYLAAFWAAMGLPAGIDAEPYFLFSIICGMFPDFDIILFPLNRYWPMFRHHGITHTLIGVTIVALIGSLLLWLLMGLSPLLLFIMGMIGGGVHLLGDYYSNYSIPLMYPANGRQYKLDVDMAVNPGLLAFSIPTIIVLYYFRQTGLDYDVYVAVTAGATAVLLGYCGLRWGAKRVAASRARRLFGGGRGKVRTLPTMNPLVWNFVVDNSTRDRYRITYGRWRITSDHGGTVRRFSLPLDPGGSGPPGAETPPPKKADALTAVDGPSRRPRPRSAGDVAPAVAGGGRAGERTRLTGGKARRAVRASMGDRRVMGNAMNVGYPVASVWEMPGGQVGVFWHSAEFYSPRGTFGIWVMVEEDRIVSTRRGLGPT